MGEPLKIGMIGCGAISNSTLTPSRSSRRSGSSLWPTSTGSARPQSPPNTTCGPLTVDDLLADPEVELVLNLTIPAAHAEVALRAIAAGKSVYGEKPLAATLDEAREVLAAGDAAGVRVGCAPDTVLGTGIQTARKALDDGLIGAPISASATFVAAGHERWHPNPDFYYQPGGGPLLDMGPYYVTALVTLLGPVVSVIGAASQTRDTRTIGSGPRAGEVIPVAVDTHVTGVLQHESGVLSTITMSFDGRRLGRRSSRFTGSSGR